MPQSRRILILYAHPAPQKSRVNRALIEAAKNIPYVTIQDLYETYPDLSIDVKAEQKLLLEHDVILFQHPLYWYSVPSIIKEWCDLVLEYGFAYGQGGVSLLGKAWIHSLTAGGTEEAYTPQGHNRFTIRQLLAPLDQTAFLCGMPFLAPFTLHNTLEMNPRTEVPRAVEDFKKLLDLLSTTDRPWGDFTKLERVNEILQGGHA